MSRKQTQSLNEKMHAKGWRALPQTVALGGDTRPAKRRRARGFLKTFSVVLFFGGILSLFVYVWLDMITGDREEFRPVGLDFINNDGVLDEKWFRKWTGFDERQSPNLTALQERVACYPQVSAVRVLRLTDGRVRVALKERRPVARLFDESGAARLVADDGVVFPAETFPPTQSMLPILCDVKLRVCEETGFEEISGIAAVVEFIDLSRSSYRKLFSEWESISLKDFPADPRDVVLPWAVLRVTPRATARNPARAQISEIVFSASLFREDLKLLAAVDANGTLDALLGAAGRTSRDAYRILFISNRKTPGREFREMRMIPTRARAL